MAIFGLLSLHASAQLITDDPGFRTGKLENGMSYYLYHNELPAGCADFYIAHDVGALQEDDNQNGLAHFLEHMAFNGTRHYPDKKLLDFLGREGVRFGYNVNAYTSRTETVYNISSVPLVRESFVDSVLLVLHDWSCDISCEQDAIDAERGVIHEEWRRRDGQRYRMTCRQNEYLYKGSKQPSRTVLGDMDIILNFKREEILDFYHRWYRPDLQAIIIAGDIDVDQMEAKLRSMFSDICGPQNPEPKEDYSPEPLSEPVYANLTDPQLKFQALKIFYKSPYPAKDRRNTEEFLKEQLARQVVSSVIGDRLERITVSGGSPAKSAVVVSSEQSPDFYLTQFTLTPQAPDGLLACLDLCNTEIERLLRFGISREEFDMARFTVMKRSRLTTGGEEAEMRNADAVKVCLENFLRGIPLVTLERLRELKATALMEMTYEEISAYPEKMFRTPEVVYANCVNSSRLDLAPDFDAMKNVVASASAAKLEPSFIQYPHTSLDVVPEHEGSIRSSQKVKGKDIWRWKLSNGAIVWFRRADPVRSDVHVDMEFFYDSGCNSVPAEEAPSVFAVNSYIRKYSGFRGTDRGRLMNSPQQNGMSFLLENRGGRYSTLSVSAGRGKEEDAFRLAYLQLSDPWFNTPEVLSKVRADLLANLAKDPGRQELFNRKCNEVIYGGHPWKATVDSAAVSRLTPEYVASVFQRCYGDPSRLTLYICSDLDEQTVRGFVTKYVASLQKTVPAGFRYGKLDTAWPVYSGSRGVSEEHARAGTPLCEISCTYLAKVKGSRRECATIDFLDYIMSARCTAQIREARGGTYHVGFGSELFRRCGKLESLVKFQTRPELKEILLQDVRDLMARMCQDGPTEEEMSEALSYYLKYGREAKAATERSVVRQLDQMRAYVEYGVDYDEDYPALISSISSEDVRNMARRLASGAVFEKVYTER